MFSPRFGGVFLYKDEAMAGFDDVRFPVDIALGARGGPERRTDIVTLGSGAEVRNARWQHARRKWDAGFGVKTFARLAEVVSFFEERRGRLRGFCWRDRLDFHSAAVGMAISATDQRIGTGDGAQASFQLVKSYGAGQGGYQRPITKPVAGTVRIAVGGVEKTHNSHFTLDHLTGIVTFSAGHVPAAGAAVTAGFQFDVPVRFDTDFLEVDMAAFEAGTVPSIPVIEIR
jgi:uncharacterized protein (TIGR02217 family)